MKPVLHNRPRTALNTHLLWGLPLFLTFIALMLASIAEGEIGLAVGFGIATLLPIFAFIISPLYFVFDDEQLKIVYLFGLCEEISWDSIRNISLMGSWFARGDPPHYVIAYPQIGQKFFFMNADIPKTRKTKKLLALYYPKKIVE